MFTPNKIESTIKPAKFESLNNGIWYYNYDIVEKTVMVRDMNDEEEREETRYEFVQVRITGKPTLSKCYEAILKEFKSETGTSMYDTWTLGLEQDAQYEDILYAVKVDFGMEKAMTPLEAAKKNLIKQIDEYDSSNDVNAFILNGIQVWLNKDTRVGLMNSLTIEKNAGKETSTLWFGNIKLDINTGAAIQMLSSLELYALECYNKTAEHKVNIENMTSVEDVINYDFTEGYPDKLNLSV